MSKPKTKSPTKKRTKTFTPGERWSIFFTKGETRNRVRVFPSGEVYKISVVKTEAGTTTDRSVESYPNIDAAREALETLQESATGSGWKVKVGVMGNNVALFE